jgi:hypothetical protein
MKYLLVVLLVPMLTNAQLSKFKAFEAYNSNNVGKDIMDSTWEKVSILVTMDFANKKFKTYGKIWGDYDIVKIERDTLNSSGDNVATYIAIDENGKECTIFLQIFKVNTMPYAAGICIRYPKEELFFKLKGDY